MPDDVLNKAGAVEPPEPRSELPRANINIPLITQLWIKWLPASIFFFGLAFVGWTAIQVIFVGRYHDDVSRLDARVKKLEKELVETQKQYDGEYWGRQCRQAFDRRGFPYVYDRYWP